MGKRIHYTIFLALVLIVTSNIMLGFYTGEPPEVTKATNIESLYESISKSNPQDNWIGTTSETINPKPTTTGVFSSTTSLENGLNQLVLSHSNPDTLFTPFGTNSLLPDKKPASTRTESVSVISPELAALLEDSTADEQIRVIITLKSQPHLNDARSIKLLAAQRIQNLAHTCVSGSLEHLEAIDQETKTMRRELYNHARALTASTQDRIVDEVTMLGGRVLHRYAFMNSIAVQLNPAAIKIIKSNTLVQNIVLDELQTIILDYCSPSIYTGTWYSAGYDGAPWDVAILDTGVDATHPALSSRVIDSQSFVSGVTDPDDIHGHGTHVAGIVASTDSTFTGIAPGASIINAKIGHPTAYDSDVIAGAEWAATGAIDDAEIINHSYGCGQSKGQFIDAFVDYYDIIWVGSAGNDGPGSGTVNDVGYNMITVGSMYDHDTTSRADDTISSFSSRGPTWDNRIKPDLVAPGEGIVSAAYDWEEGFLGLNPDWVMKSGTSMASPTVAGAVALLYDYKGTEDTMYYKSLLMNTATDYGTSGPDNTYGWGYVDLSWAYSNRDNVVSGTIQHDETRWYKVYLTAGSSYKATLVFERNGVYYPSINSWSLSTLSILNLHLYAPDGTELDQSISGFDNVEQVVISSAPSTGYYLIKVFGYYVSSGVGTETYSLATYGGTSEAYEPDITAVTVNSISVSDGGTDGSHYRGDVFTIAATIVDLDSSSGELGVQMELYDTLGNYGGSIPLFYNTSSGTWEYTGWFTQFADVGTYLLNITTMDVSGLSADDYKFYIICLNENPTINWISLSSTTIRRVNETLNVGVNATDFRDGCALDTYLVATKSDLSTEWYLMQQNPITNLFYLNLTLPSSAPLGTWAYDIRTFDQEGGSTTSSSDSLEILSHQYLLTITSPYGTPTTEGWYDADTTAYAGLDLGSTTPVDGTREAFSHWSGDATGSDYAQSDSILMDGVKIVTANWQTQYYITVTSSHGSSTSSAWVGAGEDFEALVNSPADVVADTSRWVCSGYRIDGGSLTAGTTCTLTSVSAPCTISFEWTQQFHLAVQTNPAGLSPQPTTSPSSQWFNIGASVTLTAPDITGYTFQNWVVDGTAQTGSSNTLVLTMDDAHVAVAQYEEVTTTPAGLPPGIPGFPLEAILLGSVAALSLGLVTRRRQRRRRKH